MGEYSQCLCDMGREDIVSCDGRRVHIDVRYLAILF